MVQSDLDLNRREVAAFRTPRALVRYAGVKRKYTLNLGGWLATSQILVVKRFGRAGPRRSCGYAAETATLSFS